MTTKLNSGDIVKVLKGGELFNKIIYIVEFRFQFYYCIQLKNNLKIDKRKKLRNGSHISQAVHNCYFDATQLYYTTQQNGVYEDAFELIKKNVSLDEIIS